MKKNLSADKILLIAVCLIVAVIKENILCNYLISASLLYVVVCLIREAILSKQYHLLIMSLFMGTYCVIPIPFLLWGGHIIEHILDVETVSSVYDTAVCLLLFMTMLYALVFTDKRHPIVHEEIIIGYSNNAGYAACVVMAAVCIVYGLSGASIFTAGAYGTGAGLRSSLYEYGILPLSIGLILAKAKIQKYFLLAMCAFFVFKDVMFGGRVSSIILIITVFLIQFQNRFSTKQLLFFIIVGYTFFTVWGIFRTDTTGSISSIELKEDGNAKYVFYASMRIHYLIQQGILSFQMRIESFFYFMASFFVPVEILPKHANLASFMQDAYYSGGGGLASTYFYAWLSYPGVILIAWFVAKNLNKMYNHRSSPYLRYYSVLMVATVPRWFAYYPIPLFKFCLYGVILFWILTKFANRRTVR